MRLDGTKTMSLYYANQIQQANGTHLIHKLGCKHMPEPSHWLYLGEFPDCHHALREAMKTFPQSTGCFHCSSACHEA
jgi:hypothetical protein